jgi:hypothetical protein
MQRATVHVRRRHVWLRLRPSWQASDVEQHRAAQLQDLCSAAQGEASPGEQGARVGWAAAASVALHARSIAVAAAAAAAEVYK